MKYRKLLIGLGLFVVILLIAAKVGENYAERKFTGKLIPIREDLGMVIGQVDIQPLRGRLRLKDITIPDSVSLGTNASLGSIDVSGIHWVELIKERKVKVSDLSLNDLEASFDISILKKDSVHSDLPVRIISFDINHLELEFDREMNPSVGAIDAEGISYRPAEGNYTFELRGMRAEDAGSLIELDSLIMTPRYPKFEFGFRNGRRMGSIDLVAPKVRIHEFDFEKLTRDSMVDVGSIEFVTPRTYIFTDKRVPVDYDRYVALPHELLLKSGKRINVDSLTIKDMYLKYETINANTMNQGFIEFKNSYLMIGNVTNIPDNIEEDSIMTLDLYSRFMGAANLNAHFQFHLDRHDYLFSWKGDMDRMEISEIDKFTIPVANMNIIEGNCESVAFHVTADIDSAHGTIDFQYENLKVMAIDPETHRHRRFLSGIANMFFLNENNLKSEDDYHQGAIAYQHETERGLEHYVWTSLQQGLLYTVLPNGLAHHIDNSGKSKHGDPGDSVPPGKGKKKKKQHRRKKN